MRQSRGIVISQKDGEEEQSRKWKLSHKLCLLGLVPKWETRFSCSLRQFCRETLFNLRAVAWGPQVVGEHDGGTSEALPEKQPAGSVHLYRGWFRFGFGNI